MNKLLDWLAAWVGRGIDWEHFFDVYDEEANAALASIAGRVKRDPEFKRFCREVMREYKRWERHGRKRMSWDAWVTQAMAWTEKEG